MLRWLMLYVLILFAVPGFSEIRAAYADETIILKSITSQEKQYVLPEQVIISEEGIKILINDISYSVSQINADHTGLFVLTIDLGCSKHRPVCPYCGGCMVWGCRYRCACNGFDD